MTFSVVSNDAGRIRVVGTIWALQESGAQQLASELIEDGQRVTIKRTEEREIPFKLQEYTEISARS